MRRIDMAESHPLPLSREFRIALSIRLTGEVAMRREHIANMTKAHGGANNRKLSGIGLAFLLSDLEEIDR